jgi:hypothetical protein
MLLKSEKNTEVFDIIEAVMELGAISEGKGIIAAAIILLQVLFVDVAVV